MLALTAVVAGLYGLLFGSFANVVIHRIPLEQSVVRPRSACPSCSTPISGRDNIPVVSWLLLRGRCRHCANPISKRYPLVELATGIGFVAVTYAVGLTWALPAHLWFVWSLIALSMIDFDTRKLPNRLLYPSFAVSAVLLAVAAAVERDPRSAIEAAAGAAIGYAVMFTIWFFARGGLGYGDVRLSGYIGLHLGFIALPLVGVGLFAGFAVGSIVGVAMLMRGRSRKSKVAFGPSLAAGSLVAMFWGSLLLDLYLGR